MSRIPLVFAAALSLAACSSTMSSLNPTTWFGESKLQSVADQLSQVLAGEPVIVDKSGNQITLTSSADQMFPSGGWHLPSGGNAVLQKMVPTLSQLQHTSIAVSGYTDDQPVGPKLQRMGIMNNIDLSSRRAEAVVTYLMNHGVNRTLLSANGYGANDSVASNETPEGRAKNRRVAITLTGDGT
jgi:chemotaxis protein MotB